MTNNITKFKYFLSFRSDSNVYNPNICHWVFKVWYPDSNNKYNNSNNGSSSNSSDSQLKLEKTYNNGKLCYVYKEYYEYRAN